MYRPLCRPVQGAHRHGRPVPPRTAVVWSGTRDDSRSRTPTRCNGGKREGCQPRTHNSKPSSTCGGGARGSQSAPPFTDYLACGKEGAVRSAGRSSAAGHWSKIVAHATYTTYKYHELYSTQIRSNYRVSTSPRHRLWPHNLVVAEAMRSAIPSTAFRFPAAPCRLARSDFVPATHCTQTEAPRRPLTRWELDHFSFIQCFLLAGAVARPRAQVLT